MNRIIAALFAVASIATSLSVGSCSSVQQNAAASETAPAQTYSYDITDPCYFTDQCYSVLVGSADVDSSRLTPYKAVWTQQVQQDGDWATTPTTFEEQLAIGDDGNWRHIQSIHAGNEVQNIGFRRLDRHTLQVLDVRLEFKGAPPEQPSKVYYDVSGDSFAADVTFADGRQVTGQSRTLPMPMFDGQIGGITIAALPLKDGYVATMPMIIPNLGLYWIEATVIGKKKLPTAGGSPVEVWEVNANWLNLSDGDIYEPGRDGDGGVYYIAVQPGDGVPPVVEYANNGTIIAWDGVRRAP